MFSGAVLAVLVLAWLGVVFYEWYRRRHPTEAGSGARDETKTTRNVVGWVIYAGWTTLWLVMLGVWEVNKGHSWVPLWHHGEWAKTVLGICGGTFVIVTVPFVAGLLAAWRAWETKTTRNVVGWVIYAGWTISIVRLITDSVTSLGIAGWKWEFVGVVAFLLVTVPFVAGLLVSWRRRLST
jgi:hypothetical protein